MVDQGGIIDGIIDGIERVGIIIKSVAIIKGVVIERVATFTEARLRHFCFFSVWKVADSMRRIQRMGS